MSIAGRDRAGGEAANMTAARNEAMIITVLTADKPTGKSYSLRDGKLDKVGVVNATGRAVGRPVDTAQDHAELLRKVTSDQRSVLIPGNFTGSSVGVPFDIVVKDELTELLGPGTTEEELRSGVWEIDGRPVGVAARLKESIEPCAWQVLDFDTPEGMPDKFKLDIAGRLALLEEVVPGISTCERVEARSSTARVVKPGEVPGRASHAWVRLSDPALAETLRVHIQVEAALDGLSFLSPKRSRATGEIIDHARLTLFDTSVLIRGRIVFCSAPVISAGMAADGYTVADAGVEIVNAGAGPLDISGIRKPSQKRLEDYRKLTGERLKIKAGRDGASFSVTSRGALKPETPIEAEDAPVTSFGEAVKWLQDQPEEAKIRCQAPFRESVSWAAFIKLDPAGQPYLHDSGTSTSYRLAKHVPREVPEAVTAALMVAYAELPENLDMQRLTKVFDEVPLSPEVLPNPDATQGDKIAVNQRTTAPRVHKVMDLIGMSVRQNVMMGGIECRFGDRVLKEKDAATGIEALAHACARCGMSARGAIYELVALRARANRYSPVGEWICSKPWDGRSRIMELCETLTMSVPELNAWRDLALRLWLIQTVAAIRNWENEVPTSISHLLVLQGPKQGAYKSQWIEALLPAPWVTIGMSLRLNGNERDAVTRATRTPITELGELDHSFKHSDVAALKNFLTTPKDIYRLSYERTESEKARGTSFAATLNPKQFLVDPTGERRFWPLGVRVCRYEHGIDMQQLWAEVWLLEAEGEVFWLVGAEQERLHAEAVALHKAPTEEQGIIDDLKYREGSCNVSEYVHASAKDLWERYTGQGRKGSMGNYITLNSLLEAAGYRGGKVQGKDGFYVPLYKGELSKEQKAQARKGFPVIQGGKKDE
jgi:Virulence-associated protein E